MPTNPRNRLDAVVLVAIEIAAVVVLHSLGSQPWAQLPPAAQWWYGDPGDLLLGLVRLGALAGASWSLAGTVLYAFARRARLQRVARALARLQLVAVTRVVDRAVAGSLLLATTATPLPAVAASPPGLVPPGPAVTQSATPTPAPPVTSGSGRDDAAGAQPPGMVPPTVGGPCRAGQPETTDGPARATPSRARDEHVVVAGEHLWSIARARVADATSQDPHTLSDAEIADYWRRVVAANRGRLRSGDPDLIHPGERIELPAL